MENLRVLIVDDEPGMRLGVERVLRKQAVAIPELDIEIGFKLASVGTGEDALKAIESDSTDIILLDHKLPGIQGLDVLEELTRRKAAALSIMVTAYASIDVAVTATRRGAFDFLSKPFTPSELRSIVGKAARHVMLQRQARALAAERRQLRFQLISMVSHELKSPLAAIEGYLQLLQDGAVDDDPAAQRRMIERSLSRLNGMRKLIFDLLDLTRIESGQRQRNFEEVRVDELAREAVDAVAEAANDRGVQVEFEAPSEPLYMSADRTELESIFSNLLTNAVKYNRTGGRATLQLTRDQEHTLISVSDTGIGMTEEECSRLFVEFVRIKNAKTRDIPGSGLGLSIVKRLAKLYRGDVVVQSEPGVGSTFTVKLNNRARPTGAPPPESLTATEVPA